MSFYNRNILFALILFICYSCTEEIDLQTETEFETALVVEATITNALKQQQVLLSRSYRLEGEGATQESGANVKVFGGDIVHDFIENEPGVYLSSSVFAAEPNINYRLQITTNDGRIYQSNIETLTQPTQIETLFFERGFNENNEEGVSVFVNSFDPSGNSKFYRFTYEETYKIVAPKYSPYDLVPDPAPPIFSLVPKPEPQQICYNTDKSNEIILTNTNQLEEDRLTNFRVLFINRSNAIISHRYSILVNQYVQSPEAFEFYNLLDELSSTESLLSQIQPGFLKGNLFSQANENEKVIGFFEVSSLDTMRIFFNYGDLFPDENLPPYFIGCTEFAPVEINPGGGSPLADALSLGNKYYKPNEDPSTVFAEGAYDLVRPACGNCTELGSTQVPDFWVE